MIDLVNKMKNIDVFLRKLKSVSKQILKDNLVGIYIHGSYALGSFNEKISDIDYIIIVRDSLNENTKLKLMSSTISDLYPFAPKKGVEFHVLLEKDTLTLKNITNFDFHFSQQHFHEFTDNPLTYVKKMHGTDPDLLTHIKILNEKGLSLYGKAIKDVFCQIPNSLYLKGILYDISDAPKEITTNKTYITLNLCRALAFKKKGVILSKSQGGLWALGNVPKHWNKIIENALASYAGQKEPNEIENKEYKLFASDMLASIEKKLSQ